MKSYRFKLFRNKKKFKKLQRELWQFHDIYNHSLRVIKGYYKIYGKHLSRYRLDKHLKKLRDSGAKPEWKELGYAQGRQEAVERIYKSYDAFFKWAKNRKGARKSPPKLKPFRKYKSFTLKQDSWKLDEKNGRVLIGDTWYRYNKSRTIQGTPKTINIKRDAVGDWFITVSCELEKDFQPEKIAPVTGKSGGLDFGLKTFLTANDGEKYESLQVLKQSLKDLAKLNKELSRKEKGSKNRKKARKKLARLHREISNKRTDAHFKLALTLLRKYDNIFIEDLCIEGMKRLWGRKVSDLAYSEFIRILEFKAIEHRKNLHKIDRFYPSSKLCSNQECGQIKTSAELKLKDRVYICECCGLKIDRDLNAAINIYNEGASSFGLDGVRPELVPASVA